MSRGLSGNQFAAHRASDALTLLQPQRDGREVVYASVDARDGYFSECRVQRGEWSWRLPDIHLRRVDKRYCVTKERRQYLNGRCRLHRMSRCKFGEGWCGDYGLKILIEYPMYVCDWANDVGLILFSPTTDERISNGE